MATCTDWGVYFSRDLHVDFSLELNRNCVSSMKLKFRNFAILLNAIGDTQQGSLLC